MFGIGWPELVLSAVVALVVIGPKDLPVAMKFLGKNVRRARAMFDEFRKHWDDLPNQTGLADMQRQADALQKKTFARHGVNPSDPVPDEKAADEEHIASAPVPKPKDGGGA